MRNKHRKLLENIIFISAYYDYRDIKKSYAIRQICDCRLLLIYPKAF